MCQLKLPRQRLPGFVIQPGLSQGLDHMDRCGNDPSAGSPTETLLRLHLPLNDKV